MKLGTIALVGGGIGLIALIRPKQVQAAAPAFAKAASTPRKPSKPKTVNTPTEVKRAESAVAAAIPDPALLSAAAAKARLDGDTKTAERLEKAADAAVSAQAKAGIKSSTAFQTIPGKVYPASGQKIEIMLNNKWARAIGKGGALVELSNGTPVDLNGKRWRKLAKG